MNISQLRYFITVARMEHYSHASSVLYITQPALSNSVKRLEQEVGFPLFKSIGRNVALTPEGKIFYEHVLESLETLNSGIVAAQECHAGHRQTIRVGSVASLMRGQLSSLLSNYIQVTDDNIEFDISLHGSTKELLSKISEGAYDAVFCGYPVGDPSLDWIPLFRQDAVVIVHESHPLANREMVSIKDIKQYPQLSYRPPSYMYYAFKNMFTEQGLNPKLVFDDDVSALSVIAVADDCVGIAIDSARDCLWDSIRMIPIEEFLEPYHYVGMAFIAKKVRSPEMDRFIEYALNYSKENIHVEATERRYYR
ncbi:MAG: LysR family transcriptional regulator [Eggerthellaceae bacterium]